MNYQINQLKIIPEPSTIYQINKQSIRHIKLWMWNSQIVMKWNLIDWIKELIDWNFLNKLCNKRIKLIHLKSMYACSAEH